MKPLIESRTAAQLMASRLAQETKTLSSGLSPDEERAVLQANMDRYYVDLLDEPVPMLGNIAPRRAAKSPKSRKKLVAWRLRPSNGTAVAFWQRDTYPLRITVPLPVLLSH